MEIQTIPDLLHLDSYDYHLPQELIAQQPVSPRDASRLLSIDRATGALADHVFTQLPQLLQPGDLLVINDTRVIPARLRCDRGEVLLVRQLTDANTWEAMVQPGKRFRAGAVLDFGVMKATVISPSSIGRILKFDGNVQDLLDARGQVPLPPYIERPPVAADAERYQTVYADISGSVAAPTAGLHFTESLIQALADRGIQMARITLHVGPGTFRPVKTEDIRQHVLHSEEYFCTEETWKRIEAAPRVIAVGTTGTRTLESIVRTGQLSGSTDLFIYPGFDFRVVRGLITNFHLPKSSLLMLVSAFGGFERIRSAYRHAVDSRYRFYSYGDAMVIL